MNDKNNNIDTAGFLSQPWIELPKNADYYSFRYGFYTPSKDDLLNKYPNITDKEINTIIGFCEWQSSKDILGGHFKTFIDRNENIELKIALETLTKIKKDFDITKLRNKVCAMASASFKQKTEIIKQFDDTQNITKYCSMLKELSEFLHKIEYSYEANLFDIYLSQHQINKVTSYIEDIPKTAETFQFKDETLTFKNSKGEKEYYMQKADSYFKFIADDVLPTIPEILKGVHDKLKDLDKINTLIGQKNSQHIEIQHFCRSFTSQLKGYTGKPLHNVTSKFANFIFGEHYDLDISEDYVKQINRYSPPAIGSEKKLSKEDEKLLERLFKGVIKPQKP